MEPRSMPGVPGQSQPQIKRVSCYLCETQKLPWAVIDNIPGLPDGNYVCRSCVNFEGIERIGQVIEETVRQKSEYARSQMAQNGARDHHAPKGGLSGRDQLIRQMTRDGSGMDPSRSREPPRNPRLPHEGRPNLVRPPQSNPAGVTPFTNQPQPHSRFMPAGTQGNLGGLIPAMKPHLPSHSIPNDFNRRPTTAIRTTTGISIPTLNPSPVTPFPINDVPKIQQQQLQPVTPSFSSMRPKVEQVIAHSSPSSLSAQTIDILNKCVPFRIRYRKDSTIRGRVYYFSCKTDLKVFIEYPIGQNKTYKSVQAVAHQMALDAVGGNMEVMTPVSGNGLKDIQYEVKHRSDDWRLLGDLLTDGVRRFSDPVQTEMLPTKYSDPNAPTPPVKAEQGDSEQESDDNDIEVVGPSPTPRENKRIHIVGDDGPERKWSRPEASRDPCSSASPKLPPSQKSNSPRAGSPDGSVNGRTDNAQLLCFLCKNRLEASHFVQCPSQQLHRFCFPCCQKTIQRALNDNPTTEVFCPSGMRCAISGSQNPWAFMQAEIETILDRAGHVSNARTANG